jgi:fluoroquinolone transport system permease protein
VKRVLNSMRFDILSLFRNGICLIYAIVSILYIFAIRLTPRELKNVVSTVILFSDPSLLGFYFIGAIILLEKDHHTMENIFATPLSVGEYIVAKTIALSIVTVVFSFFIVIFSHGFDFNPIFLFLGVLLSSFFFTLLGFIAAVKVKSLNGFLWMSPLYVVLAFLPIAETLGIYKTGLFYLIPGKASLILIEAAFNRAEVWQLIYALFTMALLIAVVYRWTCKAFYKHVILGIGGK